MVPLLLQLFAYAYVEPLCWYLDSTFCSGFHSIKQLPGMSPDSARLYGLVLVLALTASAHGDSRRARRVRTSERAALALVDDALGGARLPVVVAARRAASATPSWLRRLVPA